MKEQEEEEKAAAAAAQKNDDQSWLLGELDRMEPTQTVQETDDETGDDATSGKSGKDDYFKGARRQVTTLTRIANCVAVKCSALNFFRDWSELLIAFIVFFFFPYTERDVHENHESVF